MMYSLKNLAGVLSPESGYGFIKIGLIEIYNLIHSIPNYNYEPYVQLNVEYNEYNKLEFNNYKIRHHQSFIRDSILECRNNLKNMIKQRLKYVDKTDTTILNTQASEYNGNEAYNAAKNTAKGTNNSKTSHISNTEYQDNEYLKEDITKYIKQFTKYLGDYINVYIIGRRAYIL